MYKMVFCFSRTFAAFCKFCNTSNILADTSTDLNGGGMAPLMPLHRPVSARYLHSSAGILTILLLNIMISGKFQWPPTGSWLLSTQCTATRILTLVFNRNHVWFGNLQRSFNSRWIVWAVEFWKPQESHPRLLYKQMSTTFAVWYSRSSTR